MLRTVVEGRQQQVELPLELLPIGSEGGTKDAEGPGQVIGGAGERMLAGPWLRRTTPTALRSACGQSGALSPHTELRVP